MKIIVCIKQVPDTAEVKIHPQTNTLIRDGVDSIINPYDLHAVEAALRIKENIKASNSVSTDASVTALTMGPPQAESALRDIIAMGVDNAVLLSDRTFAGSDTWATAYTLANAIKILGYDIIICGKQAIDGDTAQVGPGIAEFLGIPHVAYVGKISDLNSNSITVHRMMDDSYDIVEAELPVLLTVVRELNQPRLPSLKGKMRAKKIEIRKLNNVDMGLEEQFIGVLGSPTQVKRIFAPERKKDRKILEGTINEQVEELAKILESLKCMK